MLYDVAVIGGGVVGALTARELMKYRLKVCLLEKEADVGCGATRANSAIVHGGFDPEPGTLKAKLNVAGTAEMPALTKELGVPYRQNASLVVAFNEEQRQHLEMLYARGLANGVPALELLTGDEARKLEPNLSPAVTAALRSGEAGIVCPYQLAIAAVGNAMDNGMHLYTDFAVDAIRTGEVFTLCAGEKQVQAKYVINAAGLYADKVAALIGDDSFAIHPKRGEYLLLDKRLGGLVNHTVFQVPTKAGKGVLVTPTVDGNLLVGPTSTPQGSREEKDLTAQGLAFVQKVAGLSVENIPYKMTITGFAGLRAGSTSEDFILRPSLKHPRFLLAAGIESPGLSSAPAIARCLRDLLAEAGLPLEKNPDFKGSRPFVHAFRHMSPEEKNAVIRADSRYGRVVCRCESITEGEIVAAIHANPPAKTVDAVKRRTRAGMGRCQGGFCTPLVTEILARELGIPETEVTKCGGKSYLLTGMTREEAQA